jgi:two-component system, OmpR family, KDP operon response regulator KdpE
MPTMYKILVIDDDEKLLKLLGSGLKNKGFQVSLCCSGREALRLVLQENPAVIISDIQMPEMNGIELCRRLREITDASIIMLSCMDDKNTIVEALESGADDFVTKPYRMAELVARIGAQLRIRELVSDYQTEKVNPVLTAGEVSIEVDRRRVLARGEEIPLTPIEYTLLYCLVRNQNKVVDHRQLLTEGWGPEYIDQLEYLRLYMRYLRQKIEKDPQNPQVLKTARGVGYYIATQRDAQWQN